MKRLLLGLLFALTASCVEAATWYVDCSSGTNGAGTSFSVPFNTTSSLNWTTIGTGDDDVLFKESTTCSNAQLGGASGFPNAVSVAGSSGDKVRIGVYAAADGAEILTPTSTQKVSFLGNGTTRTEMVSLFGFTHTVLNGFKISGGSNGSARGVCVSIGANGATPSDFVTVSNTECTQGATPTNTANVYGFNASGTSTGTTTTSVTFSGNTVSGLVGTSGAFGIRCANLDGCTATSNILGANTAPTTGGLLQESTTDARAITTGSTATANAFTGNGYGIRYVTSGASTTYPRIVNPNWSSNVFRSQTVHGTYSALLQGGAIRGNTIIDPGKGTGAGSGIYVSGGASAFAGSSDFANLEIDGNTITDAGQFGVWVIGGYRVRTTRNEIQGCGSVGVANTFGRCIEYTRNGTITYPAQALTMSALSGASLTATAAGSSFASSDIDKLIVAPAENPGVCRITGFTSATVVTCDSLVTFSSTSLPSGRWGLGMISSLGQITDNKIRNAYGRQYATSVGTEGVGIGLDDSTSATLVERNQITDTDFAAIDINGGHGNRIRSNAILRGGNDPTGLLAASSIRRAGIKVSYSDATIEGNTVDCGGNEYGITSENSTTTPVTTPDAGGVVSHVNNATINCSLAGIIGNSNDTATNNAYFGNGFNYRWMAQLSFSNAPASGDLTTQTLDGASLTSDPKLVGTRPPATSPLCGAGLARAGTHLDGRAFGSRTTIGALDCLP